MLQAMQSAAIHSRVLWLVSEEGGVGAAGTWGMTKSVNAERSQAAVTGSRGRNTSLLALVAAMAIHAPQESHFTLDSNGQCLGYRLCGAAVKLNTPAELALGSRGSLSVLSVQLQTGQHSPALQVKAVGLNFRDVLNVLGMYPGDPGPPGGDCAGVVNGEDGLGVQGVVGRWK